jgi:hypothetical protein
MSVKPLVERMQRTPNGFKYREVCRIAKHFGLSYSDGRDRMYWREGCDLIARIPRHDSRDVDPVYVRKFRELIWDLIPDKWRVVS